MKPDWLRVGDFISAKNADGEYPTPAEIRAGAQIQSLTQRTDDLRKRGWIIIAWRGKTHWHYKVVRKGSPYAAALAGEPPPMVPRPQTEPPLASARATPSSEPTCDDVMTEPKPLTAEDHERALTWARARGIRIPVGLE